MSEVGDRAKGTVLLPDSTGKGTAETSDGSGPSRSGSAGSIGNRGLRTSDHRAYCWREFRCTGRLVLVIVLVIIWVIIRDGDHTLNVRWSGRTTRRNWRCRGLATTTTTTCSAGRHDDQRVGVGSLYVNDLKMKSLSFSKKVNAQFLNKFGFRLKALLKPNLIRSSKNSMLTTFQSFTSTSLKVRIT
jgi:hypothetical protein